MLYLTRQPGAQTQCTQMAGQRKPGTDRHQSTAEKDRKRVDSVTQKGPQLLLLVPHAMTRFHSLFTLPLDSSEPPTQSTAGTRRRFLAMGRVLTTVPAPTKDFKWWHCNRPLCSYLQFILLAKWGVFLRDTHKESWLWTFGKHNHALETFCLSVPMREHFWCLCCLCTANEIYSSILFKNEQEQMDLNKIKQN